MFTHGEIALLRQGFGGQAEQYYKKGFRGRKLIKALKKDKTFLRSFNQTVNLAKKKGIEIQLSDYKKYPSPDFEDYEILHNCRKALKKKLSGEDRRMIIFILSQMEYDWRRPLKKELKRILKK
ncbi:MAG: hypothetical protein ABIH38_04660 [Patescibacteria group bacterium]